MLKKLLLIISLFVSANCFADVLDLSDWEFVTLPTSVRSGIKAGPDAMCSSLNQFYPPEQFVYSGVYGIVSSSALYCMSNPGTKFDALNESFHCPKDTTFFGNVSLAIFGCYRKKGTEPTDPEDPNPPDPPNPPENQCKQKAGQSIPELAGNTVYNAPSKFFCHQGCSATGGFIQCFDDPDNPGKRLCNISGPFTYTGNECSEDEEEKPCTGGNCDDGEPPDESEDPELAERNREKIKECKSKGQGYGYANGVVYCTGTPSSGGDGNGGDGNGGDGNGGDGNGGDGNGGNGNGGNGNGGNGNGGNGNGGNGNGGNGNGGDGGSGDGGDGDGKEEGEGGSWGGSCLTGFACEGDAVVCAISKAEYERNCELFENTKNTSEYKEYGKAAGDDIGSFGSIAGSLPETSINIKTYLNDSNALGSGACMEDKTFDWHGHTFTLRFSQWCDLFRWIGLIIQSIALLWGMRIAFGGGA